MSTDDAARTQQLLAGLADGFRIDFAARLWDGQLWRHGSEPPRFTLVLHHPGSLRAMCSPFVRDPLGEAYLFDDYDIEGDILGFADLIEHLNARAASTGLADKLRFVWHLLKLPRQSRPRNPAAAGRPTNDRNLSADKEAVSYTYDLPGEVYRLFLDEAMQYSCGYFARPDEGLDDAQQRKMDIICRKLRLRSGERFLDMGCGWGGLLIHAARHYGVEAVGVTLSEQQAKWAETAVARAGLADRVRVVSADYREFRKPGGFDKAASVGMAEHVGIRELPRFFLKLSECLRPGGAYLHHSITLRPYTPLPRWQGFMRKYVFPNAEMYTLLQMLDGAAGAGFEVRDVESLREHYVQTLEHWVPRLEAQRDQVRELVGDVRYRIFRVYMAVGRLGFRSGVYNLHQALLVKPDQGRSGLPLLRTDWYP